MEDRAHRVLQASGNEDIQNLLLLIKLQVTHSLQTGLKVLKSKLNVCFVSFFY